MSPKRQFFVSAYAEDLPWITKILEKMPIGVEINDFALPSNSMPSRDQAFEMWHLWRETFQDRVPSIVHMPYLDLVPGSREPEVVDLVGRLHQEILNIAEILGSRTVLFHTGFNPLARDPEYFELWLTRTARYFRDLHTKFPQFTFLIENMWESSSDVLSKLIDAIGNPKCKACLDVGHARIYSQEAPEVWVSHLGLRLGHVHLNDNQGFWDQELALGQGVIAIDKVFTALNSLGYYGTVTLEVRGNEAALKSIEYLVKNGLA